jgi:hypothetical protein
MFYSVRSAAVCSNIADGVPKNGPARGPHFKDQPHTDCMKKSHIIIVTACLALVATPDGALAGRQRAKGGRRENKQDRPGQVLKQFDTNRNHKIDGAEKDALRTAFASNSALKTLDTNRDGQLDDHEIDSIKGRKHAAKGKARAGKRKKNKLI